MFLITSAAYLNPEFTAEFGALPPSFLPVGNKRLYQWQRESIHGYDGPIVLSLPEDFEVPEADILALGEAGMQIVRVPQGLSLGASIVYCINVLGLPAGPLRLLHGDTLISDLDCARDDIVTIAETSEYYAWAECAPNGNGGTMFIEGLPGGRHPRQVVSGFFSFSNSSHLVQSITRENYGFIRGLNAYAKERPFEIVEMKDWYDFGHVQLYFQSKARMTTQRAFNQLSTSARWVEKTSADCRKIDAEASWYEGLPPSVSAYTPKYLGRREEGGKISYQLEYLYLSTLAELYVFGRLPAFVWMQILARCEGFLSLAKSFHGSGMTSNFTSSAYLGNAMERLERFSRESGTSLDKPCSLGGRSLPTLRQLAEQLGAGIADARKDDIALWHGDFCFSNIFYDFRANHIRAIDPRGLCFEGTKSIHGDTRYDLAKLSHSVIGFYDLIVANRFELNRNGELDFDFNLPRDPVRHEIADEFRRMTMAGMPVDSDSVQALCTLLFLSMLPLHADNPRRQTALLANALRLFIDLEGGRA